MGDHRVFFRYCAKSDFLGGFHLFFGVADTNILIYNPVTVNFLLAIKVTFIEKNVNIICRIGENPILTKSRSGVARKGQENPQSEVKPLVL